MHENFLQHRLCSFHFCFINKLCALKKKFAAVKCSHKSQFFTSSITFILCYPPVFFLFYVVHQQQKINFATFIHCFCRFSLSSRPKCREFLSTLLNFLFYHFITEKHFPRCFVVDFWLLFSHSRQLFLLYRQLTQSNFNQHSIFSRAQE